MRTSLICIMCTFLLTITSCSKEDLDVPVDKNTSIVADAHDNSDVTDGWTIKVLQSPIHGSQYLAVHLIGSGTAGDPLKRITITCTENTKFLETEFLVESESPEAKFSITTSTVQILGQFVTVNELKGSGRDSQNTGVVQASYLAELSGYLNVAKLKKDNNNNTNEAGNLAAQIPLAIELDSNLGKILYEIPKSELVMSVINRCIFTQEEIKADIKSAWVKARAEAITKAGDEYHSDSWHHDVGAFQLKQLNDLQIRKNEIIRSGYANSNSIGLSEDPAKVQAIQQEEAKQKADLDIFVAQQNAEFEQWKISRSLKEFNDEMKQWDLDNPEK